MGPQGAVDSYVRSITVDRVRADVDVRPVGGIQNDGLRPDSLDVKGTGGAQGYDVHYFHGSTNVTSEVLAGTFSTGSLARQGSLKLKVVVHLTAQSSNSGTFVITARSKPGAPRDAVRAMVHAR